MAVKRAKKMRDYKLVLADLRRTERELADLQDALVEFRETLDLSRKRLAFVRSCVEKRAKQAALARR